MFKSVLDKNYTIHYVDSSTMIRFIRENSEMKDNDISKFVRDKGICDDDFGPALWEKCSLNPEEYNEEQVYWIGAFFEAHPWIEKMMIVFNN